MHVGKCRLSLRESSVHEKATLVNSNARSVELLCGLDDSIAQGADAFNLNFNYVASVHG